MQISGFRTAPPLRLDSRALPATAPDQVVSGTAQPLELMRPIRFPKAPSYPGQGQIFFANSSSPEVPVSLRDLVQAPRGTSLPLGSIPSKRWTVTPKIEELHRADAASTSLAQANNEEIEQFVKPLLEERYGSRCNLTAVELGPAMTTAVAQSLHGQNDRYLAVDLSVPYLARQQEFLQELAPAPQTWSAHGDTYDLPVVTGAADLVVTLCHPPFFSAAPADQMLAMDEVARSLKPGGEFVLFPYYRDQHPSEVTDHLLSRFELVASRQVPEEDGRELLILRKRA